MKPPRFEYHDPSTVHEVVSLLAQYGGEAKLLAGGQSLMPVLNMRLARPAALIDLRRVEGLSYIREEEGVLAIGAMTRHADVERSPLVAHRQPLLTEAVGQIGHIQIRNRGTIGGSVAHADPAAELPALLVALDATLVITGTDGVRTVQAEDFFLMYFTTSIQEQEILTEVRIPVLPARTGYAFQELARRHGDFALCGVACTLTLDQAETISDCRLGLTGVGMTPIRPREAEEYIKGKKPGAELFTEVGRMVADGIEPDGDLHASAEYRQQLAKVLTARALQQALDRARERSALGGVGA
jgi:CO/xanthine dehydrogenase FAD-binding subunit